MSGKKNVPQRVGILGGSFNPPHLGHLAMAETVLRRREVDQVWVIPCFEHPFGKPLASFRDRFEMCRLAFRRLGYPIQVLDLEKKLGGKSYTLRTAQHLKKENPTVRFFLIVGEDVAKEAKHWHGYEELKPMVGWIVLGRGSGSPIPDISATAVRSALQKGEGVEEYLPKEVIGYIGRHHLYKGVRSYDRTIVR